MTAGYSVASARDVDRSALFALFDAAREADPTYLTPVTRGLIPLGTWLDRRPPAWARVAVDTGGRVVGHLAVDRTPVPHPLWGPLPSSAVWELYRVVVHPGHRRRGIGRLLTTHAHDTFRDKLWAAPQRGSAMHQLLARSGWCAEDSRTIRWSGTPAPGIFLTAPAT